MTTTSDKKFLDDAEKAAIDGLKKLVDDTGGEPDIQIRAATEILRHVSSKEGLRIAAKGRPKVNRG
jgi:hypothetical protein